MAHRSYAPRHAAQTDDMSRTTARAATAVVATLGAAAVATALASPADAAARYSVWNRVAQCESGRNWHINTGNGYYGGLQFSAGTWAGAGGHHYAREASRATRLEQIEVARRVLHSQGRYAWPVCGPRAGLTRHSGHATGRPLPRDARRWEAAHRRHHPHRHADGRRHHHAGHRHHHADRRHHHHAVHRHHAITHKRHARHHADHHARYRVRSGDTLSKIARAHHIRGGWHRLWELNRHRVHNPNVLRVGQMLRLP